MEEKKIILKIVDKEVYSLKTPEKDFFKFSLESKLYEVMEDGTEVEVHPELIKELVKNMNRNFFQEGFLQLQFKKDDEAKEAGDGGKK